VFRAAKEGKVQFDPAVTLRTIREVEKISDDDYRAILAPYAVMTHWVKTWFFNRCGGD
jgi:hypothetical protein